MASVFADPKLRNKRHYIAASSFNTVFYSYATTLNPTTFATTGALSAVSGATSANCSQGRILREVGNRLYPDAHPGISTMMVQVYDANSGLRGYIDPNAPQFAVFNSDKPIEIVDGGDNNTTVPHKGQPVFTTGDVIAGGEVKLGGQLQLASGTSTAAFDTTTGNVVFTPSTGTFYKLTSTGAVTLTCTAIPASGTIIIIVYAGNNTVTPSTGFSSTTGIAPSTGSITVTYVSNGTVLLELARQASTTNAAGPVSA